MSSESKNPAQTKALEGLGDSQAVHLFADSMAHIAWTAEPNGGVRWFNRRFYEYTGLPAGAAVGWDWSVVIHAEDLQRLVDLVMSSLETGKPLRSEARVRGSDGEFRWMLIQSLPYRSPEGEVVQWFGTATDINDRIEAEEALRQSEQRLRGIFNAAEDFAIVLMNPELTVTEWNVGAERIFKWTREDALGQSGHIIFTPEDVANSAPECERLTAEENGSSPDERWHMRADGSTFWGSGMMTAICNSDGTTKGFVKILRDATERRRIDQELEERVRARTIELEAANAEMQGFTYSVSHDLRAPLRAIVATSHILLEDSAHRLTDEDRHLLQRQAENANKMANLIDDLLRLTRISRQEMRAAEFDFTEMVQAIASEIENSCGCTILVEPAMRAHGDAKLIRLALENLIGNACKFSPRGGTILVGQVKQAGDPVFYVRDQGIGFDMQYVEKLFLPFERLHHDEQFPGTGIGLANVKRAIERHGGRIWAESDGPSKGAVFYFTLPAR